MHHGEPLDPRPASAVARVLSTSAFVLSLGTELAAQGPADLAALARAIDDLRAELEQQRRIGADQHARLEAQALEISRLRASLAERRTDGTPAAPVAPLPAAAASSQEGEAPVLRGRLPELIDRAVTEGEAPGFVRLPRTGIALRAGGDVRTTMVHTLGPLGSDDRFVTSSIPVEEARTDQGARTAYIVAPTRLNLEVRARADELPVRTFVETDFGAEGTALRLRHAFVDAAGWTAGQTWSTFVDPEVEPLDIDFEGENALPRLRQVLVRYTRPVGARWTWALATEGPHPELTGLAGIGVVPDLTASLRWAKSGHGGAAAPHIQMSTVMRTLRGESPGETPALYTAFGAGLAVSGTVPVAWTRADAVKFAVQAGRGIGRYVTDLRSAGGQDAVFDVTRDALRPLPVASVYLAYERRWHRAFASAFTYGLVGVAVLDVQSNADLRRTQRVTTNLVWQPLAASDVIVELLAGQRVNKDGTRGTSSQVQAGWRLRF